MLRKSHILGVSITNETEDKILEYLLLSLRQATPKYYIVTPNPEIVLYAQGNPHYKKILNEAKIALPDGVGVFLGSALMGHLLKERITGVDFMEEVCKRSSEQPLRMGFLGGREGIAEKTAECLKAKYPWLDIAFIAEEWESARSKIKDQRSKTKNGIQNTEIDILFVAFGHPKQEEWIYENLQHLPVKVAMGVGGAFDYISGRVVRAPFMIRAIGMEWLFRLIREPWRWRRQMALGKFVWLVVRERLNFGVL